MFLCIFFFFFKQKTAYEVRISDWSSDVCSSDLYRPSARRDRGPRDRARDELPARQGRADAVRQRHRHPRRAAPRARAAQPRLRRRGPADRGATSEERRVGKEWVTPCSSPVSHVPLKKHINKRLYNKTI